MGWVAPGDAGWCLVVLGGHAGWCLVMLGGAWWCWVVMVGGAWWCQVEGAKEQAQCKGGSHLSGLASASLFFSIALRNA